VNGEKPSKAVTSEAEAPSRRTSVIPESNGQVPGQSNTFPRQYAPRAGKGRRGDFNGQDRRKDSESVSPTKENGVHHERGASIATQTEGKRPTRVTNLAHRSPSLALEDGERRASNLADGQQPHQSKRGSNDRQFGSFGRDRNRGGARGGRGNHQNGHQYTNGHMPPMKNSSAFSGPLSPTSFNQDPNAYFSPPSGRFRNGPRSQSVAENMYRMPGPYNGPQQVPPIQTYAPGMYDFQAAQPMSAVPYGTYGMDQFTLFSMVSTQLYEHLNLTMVSSLTRNREYYFSLENLLKDMYLRKQMDSKGFVFFTVIAGFNRIKHLSTDTDLIKLVCYQSRNIEFRIGNDGKERLRLREGWEQWVLPMAQRDSLAQNEGPDEVYNPPIPHPHGFDQNALPRYPEMPSEMPTGSVPFGNHGLYPDVNGFHPGASQHTTMQPDEGVTNGAIAESVNGTSIPNGHTIDSSTKAVSGEPDSFSDEQVESLTVLVRKQDQSQLSALTPSFSRTSSNGFFDSRSGESDERRKLAGRQASVMANGTGSSPG
jgi:la-related protein 1